MSPPRTGISGNILPWICWAIWTARNTLVFEERLFSPAETSTKGLIAAKEWNLAQQKAQTHTLPTQTERAAGSSTRPVVTCNTDVAWDKERKRAGLAWTISGPSFARPMEKTLIEEFVGSPLVAEALAVRAALLTAIELGITNLKLHTDCTTLLRAINGKSQHKEIIGVVSDIR